MVRHSRKNKKDDWNVFLAKNGALVSTFLSSGAQIGFAIYLCAYAFLNDGQSIVFQSLIYAIAFAIILWAMFSLATRILSKKIVKRISKNMIPTVILLTDADNNLYSEIQSKRNSAQATVVGIIGTVIFAVAVNILSSYLYSTWSADVTGPSVSISEKK